MSRIKMQLLTKQNLTALAASLVLATSVHAEGKKAKVDATKLPPAAAKSGVTYAGEIKAILDKSCIKCHGAEKQKGKLRLDSRAAALKGGENGKIIAVGKSADSVIVHNVAWLGEEDYWMPPKDNKAKLPPLTKVEVGLIRAWIDQGAK